MSLCVRACLDRRKGRGIPVAGVFFCPIKPVIRHSCDVHPRKFYQPAFVAFGKLVATHGRVAPARGLATDYDFGRVDVEFGGVFDDVLDRCITVFAAVGSLYFGSNS